MPSPRVRLAIAVGVCLLTSSGVGLAEPGTEPATNTAASAPDSTAPARAGSWINVDPQTGRRIPAPSGGVAIPASPAFSTSHQGLVEKTAPGGGVMIDLQGRFRSAATATVGADGTVHRDCVPPGMAARKE